MWIGNGSFLLDLGGKMLIISWLWGEVVVMMGSVWGEWCGSYVGVEGMGLKCGGDKYGGNWGVEEWVWVVEGNESVSGEYCCVWWFGSCKGRWD